MVNKYFIGLESLDEDLVWDMEEELWKKKDECKNPYSYFNGFGKKDIQTLKAAKAHIRRHNEIPKGTRFLVVNRYEGLDQYLTK